MKVGLIDYGAGNFSSVYNAVQSLTGDIVSINNPKQMEDCSHIILPGVGAFHAAMERLISMNLVDALMEEVLVTKKPFLGICVGMQLLANYGNEFQHSKGLGFVEGEVSIFDFCGKEQLPLPHIGWNDLVEYEEQTLFDGIESDDPSFYFVHSFHLKSSDGKSRFAYCNYGYRFIAALERENMFGVQFHPEKSQKNGLTVLSNFLTVNG